MFFFFLLNFQELVFWVLPAIVVSCFVLVHSICCSLPATDEAAGDSMIMTTTTMVVTTDHVCFLHGCYTL